MSINKRFSDEQIVNILKQAEAHCSGQLIQKTKALD